jgi:hypothetical protein
MYLNVYLRVNNMLDSKNIMGVYSATGNPDDDGFLAASEYQNQINSQLRSTGIPRSLCDQNQQPV